MNVVLSLCDRTGNMVRPWIEAGYEAVTVDLQEQENPHPRRRHIVSDVTDLSPEIGVNLGASIIFASPPCTHLASSGARWFRDKGLETLVDALQIVIACRNIAELSGAPWMLENPVGTLSTYWRDPDFTFDPNDYGDPYTKKTCLWTGGGFVMPPVVKPGDMFAEPTWVEPTEGSKIHRMPPSKDRGDRRSITPVGFAAAVFRANAKPEMAVA